MIIGVDGGHALVGVIGARGNNRKEEVEDRKVRDRLIQMLREYGHTAIDISVDTSYDEYQQLIGICNKANAYNLDLSVHLHLNAFGSSAANGVETFSYPGSKEGYDYSKRVQDALVSDIGWTNRGCKTANYVVLSKTKNVAILVEMGFITNYNDMAKFNVEKIAAAIFRGITGTYYKPSTPPTSSGTKYRVYTGSFTEKGNADSRIKELKGAGFDSFTEYYAPKKSWRVVTGSFGVKSNAEDRVRVLGDKGFDSFIGIK